MSWIVGTYNALTKRIEWGPPISGGIIEISSNLQQESGKPGFLGEGFSKVAFYVSHIAILQFLLEPISLCVRPASMAWSLLSLNPNSTTWSLMK